MASDVETESERLWVPVAVGIGLVAVLVAESVAIGAGTYVPANGHVSGVVTALPFIGILLYGSYRVEKGSLDHDRYLRISRWSLGGAAVFLLINIGVMATRPLGGGLPLLVSWTRWAVSIGGGTGFLVGVFEARAIERQLDAERSRIRQEELRSERDRLEEFADIVSHDLRNPLNAASGHLELARDADPEAVEDHLDRVESALGRMHRILEDTLTLAREGKTAGDTTTVDIGTLTTECWGRVDGIDAELVVEEAGTIRADPDRLSHVFENLLANAVEHGGRDVTVRVGPLGDGDAVGFYVEDDGDGIPERERDRVFEKGYSADDGTGFGLAIVERIVDAHGWSVRVTEGAAGGARFEITGVEPAETAPTAGPAAVEG
ncbi:HAMP domain-containing histidine kinase [Halobellus sp. MBLA0160]|uniref:histidine kinase n=1 Tax=Halobellus ruber TaxID=2761102 RepID=A0A7J9SL03_9EURY|nr:HAMP domain-containing histidine kinase [Halobellus ruber]